MILVDANVALKWFLPEPGTDAALALISRAPLFAPSLIRIEVLSGITRATRLLTATKEDTLARCESWYSFLQQDGITLIPDTALLDDAVRQAIDIKHAFKDCLYLAAARQLQARLITADRTFYERARGAYPNMELLAGCAAN